MKTVFSEILSRGLLWLRVLLLGAFIPVDDYGLILACLAIEGLISATTSYPFIKDILVRQDLSRAVYLRFVALFALVSVPVVVLLITLAEMELAVTIILVVAAFLNALSQIGLYVLRVANITAHNRAKVTWSVLTTLLFLTLLPLHWSWLPIVYLVGAAWILSQASRAARASSVTAAYGSDLAHHLRGWLIFGTQALLTSLPQHGVRLIVAATMTLADVAYYTQVYMFATALFFVYSAVMISVEPALTRAAPPDVLRTRFPLAFKVAAFFIGVAIAHYFVLRWLDGYGILQVLLQASLGEEPILLVAIMAFTAANGVQIIANALVLAASARVISLMATVIGALVLLIGLVALMPDFGLSGIGVALAGGQLASLIVLVIYTCVYTHKNTASS